jgi:hypothetical protein
MVSEEYIKRKRVKYRRVNTEKKQVGGMTGKEGKQRKGRRKE